MSSFQTLDETLAYIETFTWSAWKIGLARIVELMRLLGDPQKELKFVHVAGTNGKGSVCAMTAAVLQEAGYRTGMFTSPHLTSFLERIRINGEMIGEEELIETTTLVARAADGMEDHPSQFELTTAIALVYFAKKKCDIVVLEVGMGGAFDSTNVIDAPEAAVICNIGLDHTNYLGNTLEEIARVKAGIIKPGCSVAVYDQTETVMDVIEGVCKDKNVPIYRASDESMDYEVDLPGLFQKRNAATVLAVVRALRDRGWAIPEEAVEEGLLSARWPARFETLSEDPLFILDGGHNLQCAEALSETLDSVLPGRKVTFLMGMLLDKDTQGSLDVLIPHAAEFVCIEPKNARAMQAGALAELIRKRGIPASSANDVSEAVVTAFSKGRPVVAFGSLYLAGEIRDYFVYRQIRDTDS